MYEIKYNPKEAGGVAVLDGPAGISVLEDKVRTAPPMSGRDVARQIQESHQNVYLKPNNYKVHGGE